MKFSQELGNAEVTCEDYFSRMQTKHTSAHVHRRCEYEWANNDGLVRKVIAACIAQLANGRKIPETIEELQALDAVALTVQLKNKSDANKKGALAAQRVGGFAPYLASLVYRGLRLGLNSVQLAAELNTSPVVTRQTLHRMNKIAGKIQAGTFALCSKPRKGRALRTQGPHHGGRKASWDVEKAIQMRREGYSLKEIGAKFGVGADAVCSVFKRRGVPHSIVRRVRPGHQKFNHTEAMAYWRDGWSLQEIADHYGVDMTAVWWLVNKSPLAEPRPKLPEVDMRAAMILRIFGWSWPEIGKKLGVPYYRAEYRAKVLGLVVPVLKNKPQQGGPEPVSKNYEPPPSVAG